MIFSSLLSTAIRLIALGLLIGQIMLGGIAWANEAPATEPEKATPTPVEQPIPPSDRSTSTAKQRDRQPEKSTSITPTATPKPPSPYNMKKVKRFDDELYGE